MSGKPPPQCDVFNVLTNTRCPDPAEAVVDVSDGGTAQICASHKRYSEGDFSDPVGKQRRGRMPCPYCGRSVWFRSSRVDFEKKMLRWHWPCGWRWAIVPAEWPPVQPTPN